jgi:hypothetical protein
MWNCNATSDFCLFLPPQILTSWSWVLPEKLPDKSSPKIYRTRRFSTVFTWARHWSRSCQTNPVHIIPFYSCILILSSHLHLDLNNCLFPSGLPTKPCIRVYPHLLRFTRITNQLHLWPSLLQLPETSLEAISLVCYHFAENKACLKSDRRKARKRRFRCTQQEALEPWIVALLQGAIWRQPANYSPAICVRVSLVKAASQLLAVLMGYSTNGTKHLISLWV